MVAAALIVIALTLAATISGLIMIRIRPQIRVEAFAPLIGQLLGWGVVALLAGMTGWRFFYFLVGLYSLWILWKLILMTAFLIGGARRRECATSQGWVMRSSG